MSRLPVSPGILHHIRHAEQWLRWARSDCERGDTRTAVLRLLLAEAEVRRARESGAQMVLEVPAPGRRRHASVPALGAVAVAALLAMIGYVVLRPQAPGPAAGARPILHAVSAAAGPAGIIRFESGRFLTLTGLPPEGWQGSAGETGPAVSWGVGGLGGRPLDDLALPVGDPEPAFPLSR